MRTLFNLNPTSLNAQSGQWRERLINGLLIISLVALAIANNSRRPSAPEITLSAPATSIPEAVTRSAQLAGAEAGAIPKGLTASDWAGIKSEYERHRHAAFPVEGGHQARNHGQQWLERFDGRGIEIEPVGSNWRWGLELRSYGFAGSERAVHGKAQVSTETERVTYAWNDELDEWFVNDRRGLEHGFTLKQRPERGDDQASALRLRLTVRGGLRAKVQADGRGVSFIDDRGSAAINYTGLKVWDADGKEVAAHFSGEGEEVQLSVEEGAARYPLTIDPIAQQAYLKASNTETGDSFGSSIAISGETIVVGAPFEDSSATGVNGDQSNNGISSSGAVYVFVRSGGSWSQQAYLKSSNPGNTDRFGDTVAISGETIVVGAPFEDSNATGVNGDQSNDNGDGSGAAYVFIRSGVNWSQQAYLKASNTDSLDQFGHSVSISGETIVVGAQIEASSATGVNGNQSSDTASASGAAYVFIRTGMAWSQQAYLKASNSEMFDQFGQSVSISGETIVVGAIGEDSIATGVNGNESDNNAEGSGAAYIFLRTGSTWSQQAYLKASNCEKFDNFGEAVAISGETIVVGVPFEDSSATIVNGNESDNNAQSSGAAYVFFRTGSTWSQQAYLKGSNSVALDGFGSSVAISGDRIAVGAKGGAGTAYVFIRTGMMWGQQAFLNASNSEANDQFGFSVAISSDTVAVGAHREDSNAIVINGDQLNNAASNAGAAYVFTDPDSTLPTITPEFGITRQAGSPSSNSTIATVGDADSGASGVTVTVNGSPSATVNGVTVTNIVNTNGTVTADIVAACGATNVEFTLTATDSNGGTAPAILSVTVTPNTAPSLTYPAMPSVIPGNSTMVSPTMMPTDNGSIASISIVNVVPPLTTPPTIDSAGVVSITNAGPSGNHTVTVMATDNCGLSTIASFNLNVICGFMLPGSVSAGTAGTPYSASVAATPSNGVSYSLLSGNLSPGLTLNVVTGLISGTPHVVGSYNFVIKAQAGGCSAVQSYSLTIGCPTIAINPGSLSNGTVGVGYSVSFSATPASIYQFSVSAGALPPGLSLNMTTGVLSGTPTTANTYNFTIMAKGFGTCTQTKSYSLTINPAACPPSITLPALPNGKVGQYFSNSVSASPSDSYSYAVTSGSLPPGVSLISSLGLLIGNPTTPGGYSFTITATRSGGGGCTGSRSYTVTIAP